MTEDVDIGLLRPATITLTIAKVFIVVMMVEVDLDHKRPATLPLTIVEFIILVLMVEVELGLKITSTFPLTIMEKELMLKGDVDIDLIPANTPPITQATVVYC